MGFEYLFARGIAGIVAGAVNRLEPHKPKHHGPVTKDRMISSLFGGAGFALLSDEGKDKYIAEYLNRINPPKKSHHKEEASHE